MALDKNKKEKIDQILLNNIFRDTDDLNNSSYIWKIYNSVSQIALLDWDKEEIYLNCILALYETFIEKALKEPTEDINDKFIGKAYNLTKFIANEKSVVQHRMSSHSNEWFTSETLRYDGLERPDEWLLYKDDEKSTKSFIANWFLDNQDMYSQKQLDYIEHPYPRDKVDKDGNVIRKGAINYNYEIRLKALTRFNKQFSKRIGTKLAWNKKTKYTPEQQQQWEEQFSLIIDTAEILSDIDTIDTILDSDHIGAEFNKYKDTPLLFNMFYDNISAASRRSINKEYYSNDSISELKSNLENQKNKLINKLHKKEVELNDINSKATFNK